MSDTHKRAINLLSNVACELHEWDLYNDDGAQEFLKEFDEEYAQIKALDAKPEPVAWIEGMSDAAELHEAEHSKDSAVVRFFYRNEHNCERTYEKTLRKADAEFVVRAYTSPPLRELTDDEANAANTPFMIHQEDGECLLMTPMEAIKLKAANNKKEK